jgi:hypothetical protein
MVVSGYQYWADITNTFGHHLSIIMNDTLIENRTSFLKTTKKKSENRARFNPLPGSRTQGLVVIKN